MRGLRYALAAALAGLVALATPLVVGEMSGPMASVIHAARVTPRVAGQGQAQIVPITRGEYAYLGEFSLAAGKELEPRIRQDEEYLYVLRGSAILTVNQRTFLVGPRMGIYIPAKAQVSWTNGPDQLVAVQVFAGPDPWAEHEGLEIQKEDAEWPQQRPRKRRIRTRVSGR